jgi:NAD-dependent dihydropyrimidine dehydrogenase PreA subunit
MAVKQKKYNWFKLFFQFSILALLIYMGIRLLTDKVYIADFEAYCPFGGIQALGSFITVNSLACAMTTMQIAMGVMVIIGIVLFSKLFCGYICPLGTIAEWLGKLGIKLKIRMNITGIYDIILRALKYVLLFITFYFTLSSSELFCKKFDPYYAVASGFSSDVVLWWALIAIIVFVAGSVIFRLFWCRYLCPFGALSNLFRFSWWFAGMVVIYAVLSLLGVKIPYIYLLAVLAVGGYILELLFINKVKPTLVHITRNTDTCTNCNLCSRKCPQGIDVAHMEKVSHVDCNLCGDCLYACPEKDTLQINRKNLPWLPAAVLSLLIVIGFILGSRYELPTIDVKWGTEEQISESAVFIKAGLKNVKCFGSSTAFANQMRKIKGVYGVKTFVGTHTVKILYDKSMYDDVKLQEIIFVPEKRILSTLKTSADSVAVYSLTVDNFFDPFDAAYLQYLLQQKTEACGYQSEFACPVIVRIYFPQGKQPDPKTLSGIIESQNLIYQAGGRSFKVKLNYKVVSIIDKPKIISGMDYVNSMYIPFSMKFNKYSTYSGDVVSVYEVPIGKNAEKRNLYSYIGSNLSNFKGIIGFETSLDSAGKEMCHVLFVDSLMTGDRIFKALKADSILLHYTNGRSSKILNPFSFPDNGVIKNNEKATSTAKSKN